MNSPTLICLAYVSDFCEGINKFTCKSIMHDYIHDFHWRASLAPCFLSSTQQSWQLVEVRSPLCLLCAKSLLFIQPNAGIIKCISVKIYNETEIV